MSHEEIIQLEKQLQTANRKLFSLKERLLRIQGTDATMEFRLEEEIAEVETVQNALQKRLAEAYNFHHQEGATILRKKITALNIEKRLGILHLVNCNRESMKDRFWEAFDAKEFSPFQFYFIHACPTQMPPSFSERMIYELIYEELEEEDSAIYLSRKADSGRVRFATLPLGRNLRRCQQAFKKYFAQHFKFKAHQDFDQFIKTGLPQLDYEYIALVFELSEDKWKDFYADYFQWLIQLFSELDEDMPTFLFFFVVYVKGLHEPSMMNEKKTSIVTAIDALCEKNDTATSLSPLQPVPLSDLEYWFQDLGERNPTKVREVIDTMAKGLKPARQKLLHERQLLNMDNIERIQELVYDIAQSQTGHQR